MIVGASPAYSAVVERYGLSAYQWPKKALCLAEGYPTAGVELDSYHVGGEKTGTSLYNGEFSGFDQIRCPGSTAISVSDYNVEFFDPRNTFEQVVVIGDSPLINLCSTAEKQVAIHDFDGSFSGIPGFIISDSNSMKADPACVSLEGTCAAVCPGVCLPLCRYLSHLTFLRVHRYNWKLMAPRQMGIPSIRSLSKTFRPNLLLGMQPECLVTDESSSHFRQVDLLRANSQIMDKSFGPVVMADMQI